MTCIHLGLPKAASSTLKFSLFAAHSQIEYLGIDYYGPRYGESLMKTISNKLPCCKDDATLEMWRRAVIEVTAPALLNGRVPVMSREGLGGFSHTRLAMNIERVFGAAKVILVVRHPVRWMESFYFEVLMRKNSKIKNTSNYVSFEKWISKNVNRPGWPRRALLFRDVLEPYVARLGKENVGVFLFEHLQSDPQRFFRTMCEFIGVDPDEGVRCTAGQHLHKRITREKVERIKMINQSPELTRIFRQASRKDRGQMLKSGHESPMKGEPATVEIPEVWRSRIEDRTREHCKYLRQEFGLPVDEAGYPI